MISFPALTKDDIEVRIAQCTEKGVQLLLYKTARCDMKLLDEAVGQENWDCEYKSIDGKLFCTVGIRCFDEKYNEWVYKQDVGVESNMEPVKGEASDAFKRACFKWGIGRELYTAPFIWVKKESLQRHKQNDNGKWTCRDMFSVRKVVSKNGKITELEIENSYGLMVYRMGSKVPLPESEGTQPPKDETAPQTPPQDRFATIRELKAKAISLGVKEEGIESWISANIKNKKKDMTTAEIMRTESYLREMISTAEEVL